MNITSEVLGCLFGHAWNGCICAQCGKTRDKYHDLDGCVCKQCGAVKHDLETVKMPGSYAPNCPDCYGNGYIGGGLDMSCWCYRAGSEFAVCKKCGKRP